MILAGLRPPTECSQALVSVGLHTDVHTDALESFGEHAEHLRVGIGRPCLDHGGVRAAASRLEGVRQSAETFDVALVAGHEEVVVVEDEDVDSARSLHGDHLVGDGADLAKAVAHAWEALLMPRCDAAERAVCIAASARYER